MPAERYRQVRGVPDEVAAIRIELRSFLRQKDADGNVIGSYKHGVYAFYDYDNEPIYVGQTEEKLSGRISRHLTNQRTDAVAMNVLDPFEVAYIEVWPVRVADTANFPGGPGAFLNALEYTVFQKVLSESLLGAVLNEKPPPATDEVVPPPSRKGRIIPESVFEARSHPDIRIARRAQTIANLARVISERDVSGGLRSTLLTQARRLELLAKQRLLEIGVNSNDTNPLANP